MELVKKDSVSSLYALRAGLSVLSEMKDKANKTKNKIDDIKDIRIPGLENQKIQAERNADVNKNEFGKTMVSEKKQLSELENELKSPKYSNLKVFNKSFFGYLMLLIACVGIFITLIVFFPKGDPLSTLIVLVLFVVVIIAGGCTVSAMLCDVHDTKDTVGAKTQLENKITIQKNKIERLEKERSATYSYYDRACETEKARLTNIIESTNLELEVCQKRLEKEIAEFNMAHSAVSEQFKTLLDERDWKNVDLIIFYYETGRAVDLRDALMQVDAERRNERLVKAIAYATSEISYTIQSGFGELKEMIGEKMDKLNSAVLSVAGGLKDISEQNAGLQKSLTRIGDIADSQEALLRKINVSSDTMAKDIDYMKDLSHRTFYNIK